jgi:hypothetical protein
MRRTRRWLTGTVLAVTLGLTGCGDSAAEDTPGDSVPAEESDDAEDQDPVDGGEEDSDGVDPGTGGLDDDDDTDDQDAGDDATEDIPAEEDDSGDIDSNN